MTRFLTLEQALDLIELATGESPQVRDLGLLESALHRPSTTLFGREAYPDTVTKATALLHSLASNHPLIDGNKRLAWVATVVFLALNDIVVDTADDPAYDLVIAVADGTLSEVGEIAGRLRAFTR
ncbi:MAG TPA: type II toxin-antitoxin system death-on-curing family toxin [Streptosporangiaceae bacterium]